jgi:hypothetical protein
MTELGCQYGLRAPKIKNNAWLLANQMRLTLHTAAYWLMLTVRDATPRAHALCKAEFATIRARLLKIGARIRETAHRVRIAFAAACPEAVLFRDLAIALRPAPA